MHIPHCCGGNIVDWNSWFLYGNQCIILERQCTVTVTVSAYICKVQQIVCPTSHLPTNQDGPVAVRETHYHALSWSFTFQQAPRNELFATFRSSGMHHYAVRSGRGYSPQGVLKVQVDVIFPFDHELHWQEAFGKLETDYYTSRAPLAEIYESLLRMYRRESDPSLSRCVFAVL